MKKGQITSWFTTLSYRLLLVSILIFNFSSAYAVDLERKVVSTIAKKISTIDRNQKNIWPGFHISSTPTLIYFKDTQHIYAFDFSPKAASWQKLNIHHKPVYYLEKDEIGLKKIPLSFGVMVEEQPSYVIQLPIDQEIDINNDIIKFVKERFRFFVENESDFSKKSFEYAGLNQLMNIKLSLLETYAVKTYLESFDEDAEEALKDAVAIHQYRSSLLDPESLAYEQSWEIKKGIATYVALKSMFLNNEDFVQKVEYEIGLDPLLFCGNHCPPRQIAKWVAYDRFSFTGPAFGRALESKYSSIDWKKEAEAKSKSLETLIQAFYSMSLEAALKRTKEAMSKRYYRFEEIEQMVDLRWKPYLNEIKQQQENYNKNYDGPELKFDLSLSKTPFNFSFLRFYPVTTRINLLSNVNGTFISEDKLIEIHYKHMPLLYISDPVFAYLPDINHSQNRWLKFKLAPETKLWIDGKEDALGNYINTDASFSFHQLKMENSHVTIQLNREGVLSVIKGTLNLKLSPVSK